MSVAPCKCSQSTLSFYSHLFSGARQWENNEFFSFILAQDSLLPIILSFQSFKQLVAGNISGLINRLGPPVLVQKLPFAARDLECRLQGQHRGNTWFKEMQRKKCDFTTTLKIQAHHPLRTDMQTVFICNQGLFTFHLSHANSSSASYCSYSALELMALTQGN